MARLTRRGARTGRERGVTLPPVAVPRWLLWGLAAACLVLLLLDLTGLRYGYLAFEKAFGGYAVTALFAAVAAILLALALRPLLVRRADLYGPADEEDA